LQARFAGDEVAHDLAIAVARVEPAVAGEVPVRAVDHVLDLQPPQIPAAVWGD
jgi:hypothetical protein